MCGTPVFGTAIPNTFINAQYILVNKPHRIRTEYSIPLFTFYKRTFHFRACVILSIYWAQIINQQYVLDIR